MRSWIREIWPGVAERTISNLLSAALVTALSLLVAGLIRAWNWAQTVQVPWGNVVSIASAAFGGLSAIFALWQVLIARQQVFIARQQQGTRPPPVDPVVIHLDDAVVRSGSSVAAPSPAQEQFADEQRALLLAMYNAAGAAFVSHAFGGQQPGEFLTIGGHEYRRPGDRAYQTRYLLAMKRLVQLGDARAGTGQGAYWLTDQGTERALAIVSDLPDAPPAVAAALPPVAAPPSTAPAVREFSESQRRVLCAFLRYGDNLVSIQTESVGLRVFFVGGQELGNELDGTFAGPAHALQQLERDGFIEATVNANGEENFRLTTEGREAALRICPKPPVRI